MDEAPDQARGEEAVIQSLIGRQYCRFRRLLDRVAKRLQAQRLGPKKHLQDQKIDMQRGDHRDQAIGHKGHVAVPPGSGIRVDASTRAVKSAAMRGLLRWNDNVRKPPDKPTPTDDDALKDFNRAAATA